MKVASISTMNYFPLSRTLHSVLKLSYSFKSEYQIMVKGKGILPCQLHLRPFVGFLNNIWCYFLLIKSIFLLEGGRLERELEYVSQTLGEGAGTTNQLLIQTPKEGFSENILTTSALSTHLNVLQVATNVTVDMFDM